MACPQLLLISLCSRGLYDLRRTIVEQRQYLSAWRRTKLKAVRCAIGYIEPQLSRDHKRWTPHAHLIVDVDALPCSELSAEWHTLTKGRGTFSHDFSVFLRNVDPLNPYALARYISKGTDACPAPGTMAPDLLRLLWSPSGIHGAQLPIEWGGGRGGRAAAERARTGGAQSLALPGEAL